MFVKEGRRGTDSRCVSPQQGSPTGGVEHAEEAGDEAVGGEGGEGGGGGEALRGSSVGLTTFKRLAVTEADRRVTAPRRRHHLSRQ